MILTDEIRAIVALSVLSSPGGKGAQQELGASILASLHLRGGYLVRCPRCDRVCSMMTLMKGDIDVSEHVLVETSCPEHGVFRGKLVFLP
jgi:hypothetical protein